MIVKGVILDESNLDEIRANGFTNFTVVDFHGELEMDTGEDKYQQWCIAKQLKLDEFSLKYMMGQDDSKLFFFSDIPEVQEVIKNLFPASVFRTVDSDDFPLDYDYKTMEKNSAKKP